MNTPSASRDRPIFGLASIIVAVALSFSSFARSEGTSGEHPAPSKAKAMLSRLVGEWTVSGTVGGTSFVGKSRIRSELSGRLVVEDLESAAGYSAHIVYRPSLKDETITIATIEPESDLVSTATGVLVEDGFDSRGSNGRDLYSIGDRAFTRSMLSGLKETGSLRYDRSK